MTYIFPVTASWKVFVHHATIIILAEKCAKFMEVSTSTHTKNDINAKCFHYKYKKWDPIIFVAQKYIFTIGKIHKRWTKREKNVTREKAKQKELSQLLRYLSLSSLHKYINELFRFKAEFFLFCTQGIQLHNRQWKCRKKIIAIGCDNDQKIDLDDFWLVSF